MDEVTSTTTFTNNVLGSSGAYSHSYYLQVCDGATGTVLHMLESIITDD